ncbi:hypothetical protein F3J20_30675 [Paraburkholderia sp. Cy-641]|uniref:T6SS effector BTH_I2691 family protein n=1 Tax=Paraburkholderia sp. Cy-641 TaxID=2608337 RepID=UPI0014246CB6|nr:T6SS effector BTH_I2691 family protein [Paraburkholderia sp. Cy-641]NIF81681.1 hypothetical protein [Paraburkholderia sp. Cy-641]
MATNNQKCANCEKNGLPILPVRYTVLPKTVKAKIPAGITGARVTDVGLKEHQYGLRTLREGWLYLFYEVGARGNQYWEAYNVTEDGRLWKQGLPLPSIPTTHPACAQKSICVPMDMIAIERPDKCTGKVFIAFSEHAWRPEVFDRYKSDETLRKARMQWIEPSQWIGTPTDGQGHAIVATEQAIDDVIEYMPGFNPKLLSLPDEKQQFSDEKGGYKTDWLQQEVTRYPLHVRQASPASASQSLVKLMKNIGTIEQSAGGANAGGGGEKPQYPPMLLALWDGIGNVHELNGFRTDPVSWLDQYAMTERTLQVNALHNIDTAHKIVKSRTEQALNNQESMAKQAHEMTALGRPGAQTALAAQRARALASADPTRASQINAYYDDLNWMSANNVPGSYQTRLIQIGQQSSAGSASSSVPYTGNYRDQVMNEARAYSKAQPGSHDRNLTRMTDSNWSTYEARLKRPDIENFRTNYKALRSAVFDLQEVRSEDVGKWLSAKLLIDTLEDYESSDMRESLAFEVVISDAIVGLASTPRGRTILDGLITQWNPTLPTSLVWRVIAMNQMDARRELAEVLKTAQAQKNTPLTIPQAQGSVPSSSAVNLIFSTAASAGKLNGYYKNLSSLALETDPKKITPLGGLLRRLKADEFGITVGDAIFAKFKVNQLGDYVGEKIIQSVLLQRSGVSYSDAMALVRKQAELENASRLETIQRLLKTRSLLRSPAPAGAPNATQALYDVWDKVKLTDDGAKQLRTGRIAVVAALLESVNFYKLVTGAPDKDTTLKLFQSGASLCSSVITIAMSPYYATLKNSIRSQSWKLTGGALSGFGTFVSTWMDAENARDAAKKDQYDVLFFLGLKSLGGFVSGTALLIDATSTAAPLLKKLAARYGTEAIMAGVETFSERLAIVAGLRAVGMLIGWEATIGLLVLQWLADWLTPDALEAWCSRSAFGTGRETILRVTDHSVKRYTDSALQDKDFIDAMAKL